MTVLLLGAKGMLGTDVADEVRRRHWDLVALDLEDFDISNPEDSARIMSGEFGKIDWCINCAAYTAVDKAESEPDLAFAINGLGPSYLSKTVGAVGARLIQISTDFVFDGTKTTPYETEDIPNPISVYGKSKLMGEEGALSGSQDAIVLRTSWLFGPSGNSFPKTMIKAYEAGKQLRVVADQIGCPTYTKDLANATCQMIEHNISGGIFHFCGPEAMSWHEFAVHTLQAWINCKGEGEMPEITPIQTQDWPTPAKRPMYSVMSCQKLNSILSLDPSDLRIALPDFVSKIDL
jgi:dTDP-4-dehydrorhamnose reductase